MTVRPSTPRLLYVGGFTRSGSTLLAGILGSIDGFSAPGEIREVWTKGLRDNYQCSCGARFADCDFWRAVGGTAFGGWEAVEGEELAVTSSELATRVRLVPSLLRGGTLEGRLERYRSRTKSVIEAVARVTGATIVVDSSKLAPFALLYAHAPERPLAVIHLIRDSRGVAFSWTKERVVKPDAEAGTYMHTYDPVATSTRWVYHNLLFELLRLSRTPCALLRYEAMVQSPAAEIARALDRIGVSLAANQIEAAMEADRAEGSAREVHMLGGNPMRFDPRRTLNVDDAWRTELPPATRLAVLALTWPLLLRYRYRRPRGAAGSAACAA